MRRNQTTIRRTKIVRIGVTLVELLVVLAIATALAALILPSVKTLLTDRKSSQAAIVVKNYIEAARARALGKNRSVAVVLERLSARAADLNEDGVINLPDAQLNPNYPNRFMSATALSFAPGARANQAADTNFLVYNTCIKLSLAEEPAPITEQSLASPVEITSVANNDGTVPASYDRIPLRVTYANNDVRIFRVSAGSVNAADLLGEYLLAGNEISFGESTTKFLITSPSLRTSHIAYASNNAGNIWFAVSNEQGVDVTEELSKRPYVEASPGTPTSSFRIYQKPKPIYSQTLQMPKGSCIDLSLSGFASDRPGMLSDYRVRFASDWVMGGTTGVPTPEELRPIYLVFAGDGSFSSVVANGKGDQYATRVDSPDDVFLHVGRIDQVVMPLDPNASLRVRTRAGLEAANLAGVKMNLTDPSSYVIRISPKSGAVSAGPITQFIPEAADSLFDIIEKSRSGSFSSTLTGQ
jgi:Tfp pilus assembly protein FimT